MKSTIRKLCHKQNDFPDFWDEIIKAGDLNIKIRRARWIDEEDKVVVEHRKWEENWH